MNKNIKYIIEAFFNKENIEKYKSNNTTHNSVVKDSVGIMKKAIVQKILNYEPVTIAEYTMAVNTYPVNTIEELVDLINNQIKHYGNECNLNWINLDNLTDLSYLFYHVNSKFDGNISEWKFKNIENMSQMFFGTSFSGKNGSINGWKFPKVTNMHAMFERSSFNGDISAWEFPEVLDMGQMFKESKFDGNISGWKFPKVNNMSSMFYQSDFTGNNGSINGWKFPNVTNMHAMFYHSKFNSNISDWQFPKVEDMGSMFADSNFNNNKHDLRKWKFPAIKDAKKISSMFDGSKFYDECVYEWEFPNLH